MSDPMSLRKGIPCSAASTRRSGAHVAHSQAVLRLPQGASLLAASDQDPHSAFVFQGNAWGVQFHPEFDAEIVRAYIEDFQERLTAEGQDPHALAEECADTRFGPGTEERRPVSRVRWPWRPLGLAVLSPPHPATARAFLGRTC